MKVPDTEQNKEEVLHKKCHTAQDGVIFKWQHVADNSMRIDPSISNVHEFPILTQTYYDKIRSYLKCIRYNLPIAISVLELEADPNL